MKISHDFITFFIVFIGNCCQYKSNKKKIMAVVILFVIIFKFQIIRKCTRKPVVLVSNYTFF